MKMDLHQPFENGVSIDKSEFTWGEIQTKTLQEEVALIVLPKLLDTYIKNSDPDWENPETIDDDFNYIVGLSFLIAKKFNAAAEKAKK